MHLIDVAGESIFRAPPRLQSRVRWARIFCPRASGGSGSRGLSRARRRGKPRTRLTPFICHGPPGAGHPGDDGHDAERMNQIDSDPISYEVPSALISRSFSKLTISRQFSDVVALMLCITRFLNIAGLTFNRPVF